MRETNSCGGNEWGGKVPFTTKIYQLGKRQPPFREEKPSGKKNSDWGGGTDSLFTLERVGEGGRPKQITDNL